ncbi:MAG TPA: YhjD/YihY/BrkB family envelope integrity protein [Bryobacteraceae bacterium]|nr:YhjD/YihY/BrkB family envelope integrity protein [Bryobacteraceae bacterium]
MPKAEGSFFKAVKDRSFLLGWCWASDSSCWSPSEQLLAVVSFVLAFTVTSVLFAVLFKFLPDVPVSWRDVLFTIGKFVLAFYLGKAGAGSAYGAAGSVVALLVWVYYAAQIFFPGAEFTQVYASAHGSRVETETINQPAGNQMPGGRISLSV